MYVLAIVSSGDTCLENPQVIACAVLLGRGKLLILEREIFERLYHLMPLQY